MTCWSAGLASPPRPCSRPGPAPSRARSAPRRRSRRRRRRRRRTPARGSRRRRRRPRRPRRPAPRAPRALSEFGVAGDGARGEAARRVGEDGADQAAPCAPVAPTTAMIFLLLMLRSLIESRSQHLLSTTLGRQLLFPRFFAGLDEAAGNRRQNRFGPVGPRVRSPAPATDRPVWKWVRGTYQHPSAIVRRRPTIGRNRNALPSAVMAIGTAAIGGEVTDHDHGETGSPKERLTDDDCTVSAGDLDSSARTLSSTGELQGGGLARTPPQPVNIAGYTIIRLLGEGGMGVVLGGRAGAAAPPSGA